jgi:hypothetical protein
MCKEENQENRLSVDRDGEQARCEEEFFSFRLLGGKGAGQDTWEKSLLLIPKRNKTPNPLFDDIIQLTRLIQPSGLGRWSVKEKGVSGIDRRVNLISVFILNPEEGLYVAPNFSDNLR